MGSKSSAETEISKKAFLGQFVLGCFVFIAVSTICGCYFGGMSIGKASLASGTNLVAGVLAWTAYGRINSPRLDRYFLVFMSTIPINGNMPLWQRFPGSLAFAVSGAVALALIDRREEQKKPSIGNQDPMADADLDQPFAGVTPCQ